VFEPPARRTALAADALKTVFTPGDEAQKMELAALDEILAARKADPRTFPPAENPYRIEYAVYNLTDPEVIRRLGAAQKAGIRVQVLIDAKSIAPEKWWNRVVKDLTAEGFSFERSQWGLSAEKLESTNLIGMNLPGIFHLKARCFSYPDPATGTLKETLLTGSFNPEVGARKNDESLHRITDSHLVQQYRGAIEAMRDGRPIRNVFDEGTAVNALFTSPGAKGPRVVDKILEAVDAEKELICLSVFTLRDIVGTDKKKLVQRLIAARDRGVQVVVVTDKKQADGVDAEGKRVEGVADDPTDELLQRAGIPTYEALNVAGPYNAMHLKAGIFGLTHTKVVTDAGNWTFSTMGTAEYGSRNAESVLFIDSGKLDGNETGHRYLGEFLRVLRKYGPQNPGQPDVEGLIQSLQSRPGWPKVAVNFDVVARTYMGQDVYITGNTRELGQWGEGGPGVKLETDPATYPHWRKAEVELPLGCRLEYKIVKRNPDGGLSWEPGENAVLVVDTVSSERASRQDVADDFNGDA
jgi:hypothetical protein